MDRRASDVEVRKFIARYGLVECPWCLNWLDASTEQRRVFHARRCRGKDQ